MKENRKKKQTTAQLNKRRNTIGIVASILLAALLISGGILRHMEPVTVMAKESFAGIGRIVEEHDEEDPYVILDIVPSASYYTGQTTESSGSVTSPAGYAFSTGTLGYLAGVQDSLTQEFQSVFETDDVFLSYQNRWELFTDVISQAAIDSFPNITYEEAYGGIHNGISGADGWSLLFDSADVEPDTVSEEELANMSVGILTGSFEKMEDGESSTGYDYVLLNNVADGIGLLTSEIYQYAEDGDLHVTFSAVSDLQESSEAYIAVAADEYDVGSYSMATGLYLYEDGVYTYAGTVGQIVYGVDMASENRSTGDDDGNMSETGNMDGDDDIQQEDSGADDINGSKSEEDGDAENGGADQSDDTEDDGMQESEGSTEDSGAAAETNDQEDTGSDTDNVSDRENTFEGSDSARNQENSDRWYKLVSVDMNLQTDMDAYETGAEEYKILDTFLTSDYTYYVVLFELAEDTSGSDTVYYEPASADGIEESEYRPYDTYKCVGMEQEEEANVDAYALDADDDSVNAAFLYVGSGNGSYRLTASEDGDYVMAVYNAPVYIRCRGGNNWLEKYVFSSLSGGDNENSSFQITVESVRADEVTYEMIQEADLIYLESGYYSFLNSALYTDYIQASDGNETDMDSSIAGEILRRVSDELLPVIVDYDITQDKDNYEDTNYQYLARALLKKDLSAFYTEMNVKGSLMDNVRMNINNTDDFPDKSDNDYHYVNKNVYILNGDTPLVSEDFHDSFADDETERGFSEVVAAIKAENTTLSEEDQLSLSVSKARAVQYIINYSVGIIGEYGDLCILELQPTANTVSDLKLITDGSYTRLCWQTDTMSSAKQILYSKQEFDVTVSVKSVAEFNGEWEDINSEYDLIFIGLDGQKLNKSSGTQKNTVYNNEALNGKVYHTGDESGAGTYDGNDITAQKMMELLEYMEAGYPVLVEDGCFEGGTAQNAEEDEINTEYIEEDSVMYRFLHYVVTNEEYRERIFTISDAVSSAAFITQLKISKPAIALQDEDGVEQPGSSRIVLEDDSECYGTIAYTVKDKNGEAYFGDTAIHLYADLNCDGIFGAEEELDGYTNENGVITVALDGMGTGVISWKLEITDVGNPYRRDSVRGYFELINSFAETVDVLQIVQDRDNDWKNLQKMYEQADTSVLGYYLQGSENIINMEFQIETVTVEEAERELASNGAYLKQWDVVVLTLKEAENVGSLADAVWDYASEGRSLLVCSQNTGTERMGLTAELLGQAQENRTYVSLGGDSGTDSYYRYAGLTASMFEQQTDLTSQLINEGSISYYPYRLDTTFSCGANTLLRASDYLLDFEDNLKSETDTYVTVWYTLGGSSATTAYGISPRDARNNYYCYSKGNVVYLGQAEYPYAYNPTDGEKPDASSGVAECKLFVNALLAAYNAGVHKADISIVSGFASDSAKIQSISVPFDQKWSDEADASAGVLDDTVEVYFRFTDTNIAMDKEMHVSFYYEDPEGVSLEAIGDSIKVSPFASEIWTVLDNKLALVSEDALQPGKSYRIQAPVITLRQNESLNNADIYVVLETILYKSGREYRIISSDSVSLNRAQLFLLE